MGEERQNVREGLTEGEIELVDRFWAQREELMNALTDPTNPKAKEDRWWNPYSDGLEEIIANNPGMREALEKAFGNASSEK